MRLSNLLNIFMGREVSPEEELGLEAASADMSMLMSHDGSEPSFIAGTSSQLYDSHDFRDLGVWYDADEDETE